MKAQNCLEKGGAYLQCVCNHCVKVELNAIETEGVTDYTKYVPSIGIYNNMIKNWLSSTLMETEKKFAELPEKGRCTPSICV